MFPFILIAFNIISNPPALPKIEHSTSVAQGGFLDVRLELISPSANKVRMDFLNKTVPCYFSAGHQWNCLAAVPADAKTGKQKFKILVEDQAVLKSKIMVRETPFVVEPLPLSDEKKSLLSQAGRELEIKRIRAALATETAEKWWTEPFIQPIEGAVESRYGERRMVDGKVRKGYHRGLDLGAREGTPILSANDGKVILAGPFIEEGNMVIVDHGQGVISAYLHLSEISVQQGQAVKRGETIGKVGSTGVVNTPHLHFGVYIHGTPIDPAVWLKNLYN